MLLMTSSCPFKQGLLPMKAADVKQHSEIFLFWLSFEWDLLLVLECFRSFKHILCLKLSIFHFELFAILFYVQFYSKIIEIKPGIVQIWQFVSFFSSIQVNFMCIFFISNATLVHFWFICLDLCAHCLLHFPCE